MLLVENLQKSFDGFQAVQEAHLTVETNEVVAVIGPNGAGKTTLFNLITGQLRPDAGRVMFKGREITTLAPHLICRRGMARSYQVVNIFNRLSVFENVQIAVMARQGITRQIFSAARKQAVGPTMAILDSIGLAGKADNVSGSLSHGDQKVLEIAVALGSDPQLLILDEPTAGMSPEETATTLALMKRLSGQMSITVLFCEHDMNLVFAIADRIMVMHQGRTLIEADPQIVRQNVHVQEAYLGGADQCFA